MDKNAKQIKSRPDFYKNFILCAAAFIEGLIFSSWMMDTIKAQTENQLSVWNTTVIDQLKR